MPGMLRGWSRQSRWLSAVVAACAGLVPWGSTLRAATATWNGANDLWSNAADWSTNPFSPNNGNPAGTLYDVIVPLGTVSLDVNVTIQNLNPGGGTIAGTGNLTVNQTLNWSGQTLGGSGTITATTLLVTLVNVNDQLTGTRTLISTGTGSTWTSNTNFSVGMQTGATYINQGVLTVNTTGSPTWNGGTFANQGSLVKNSPDVNTISSTFNNSGTVNITAGTLVLSGGGTNTSTFATSGGGLLSISGGVYNFNNGAALIGGTLAVTGGTLSLNGTSAINATNVTVTTGGTVAGAGNLAVSQLLTWAAGGALAGSGTITTSNLAIVNVNGNAILADSRTLVSTGTGSTWTSNTNWQVLMSAASTYINQGKLSIDTVNNPTWNGGTIINQGLISKISADANTLSSVFNNSGTVTASAGALNLAGGGTHTGAFSSTGTGAVNLAGGIHTFSAGASVIGGILGVTGGSLVLASPVPSAATGISITGGAIAGTANMAISQILILNSASLLRGSGTITTANLAINNLNGNVTMADTRTLVSTGTASTWTSNTNWQVNLEAGNTCNNQGLFTINTTNGPTWNNGTIKNQGVISKISGDTNVVSSVLDNSGTITVGAGALNFSGGGDASGAFATTGNGIVALTAGILNFKDGASVSGGTFSVLGGTLNLAASSPNQATNLTLAGGIMSGSKDMTVSQLFTLGASSLLRGAGTLTTSNLLISNINGAAAMADSRTLVSTGTGSTWISNTNWTVNLGPANTYINQGTFTIATTGSPTWNGGTIANQGVFLKTSADLNNISAALNNSGTVSIGAGIVNFIGGGTHTGAFATTGAGVLALAGGVHTFNTGAAVIGGTLSITGGTLVLNSPAPIPATNVTVSSGVLTGNDLTVSQTFTAGPGALLQGSGTITAVTLSISNLNGTVALANTRTLVSTGTASTWTSNTNWQVNMAPGNTFINQGVFTVNTINGPTWSGGLINNLALFAKTSADNNILSSTFNNAGTVTVSAGILALAGGGTHTGVFSTAGTGQVVFSGGTHNFNAGVSVANIGVTGGQVNINPAAALKGGSLTVTGGQVNLSTGSAANMVNALAVNVASGRIDLKNSPFIVQSTGSADKTTKIAALNAAISAGAAGGTWAGNGITSATAAADAAHLAVGLFDNAVLGKTDFGGTGNVDVNSILIAVAHLGDANRNGIIDIQDQSIVTNHWQSAQNNWAAGDLTRDGFVDLQDLTIVTNNWQQSSTFAATPAPLLAGSQPIPEPAALGVLGGGLLALWLPRRRRSRKLRSPCRTRTEAGRQ